MSVARPGCSVPLWLEFSKFCPKNMMLNSYFLRNVSQFISTINENNSSIQVSGYLGLDSWILILSNYPKFGYVDSWISHFYMYPDTWIHGYLDTWISIYFGYMDTWILWISIFFIIHILDILSKYPDIFGYFFKLPNMKKRQSIQVLRLCSMFILSIDKIRSMNK